jgi:hypothetical protein
VGKGSKQNPLPLPPPPPQKKKKEEKKKKKPLIKGLGELPFLFPFTPLYE